MVKNEKWFTFFYAKLLSEKTKEKSEAIIIVIAIISFVFHLLLITLVDLDIVQLNDYSKLLTNPIAAIYTPFSFILIYEVYLLVYYLPKSTTIYIGKQYEIITLILIRRVFKDLSKLELTPNWFEEKNDLQLTYDLVATVSLFFLIFVFYRLSLREEENPQQRNEPSLAIARFIKIKNIMAMCLIPTFLLLAIYSFSRWVYENFFVAGKTIDTVTDVNKIFFSEFFTVLILTDVLILLISFLHTNKFSEVIRNSGFIISTILIKLSFGIEGLLNTFLIITAVLFGVAILGIHNQYSKIKMPGES
ncbi:MAG: hypothetical protein H7Z72_22795 [Bacteroidetes bacterium]|nr:hypothetical protein [Fibrella sp.]